MLKQILHRAVTLMVTSAFLAVPTAFVSAQTEVEWEGTYTVWSQDAYIYDDYVKNYLNLESLPQTFTVEIAKQGDDYVITKFLDFDLNAEGAGGPITLIADEKDDSVLYIPITRHVLYSYTYEGEVENENGEMVPGIVSNTAILMGENMGNDNITITKQTDGQIKISDFVLAYTLPTGTFGPAAWYSKNTPTNGGDPEKEIVHYDWAGTYLVQTSGTLSMVEDYTMPEAFLMTIVEDMWNPGTYVVTEFAGYEGIDLVNIFYGGIPVKFDEKDGDLCYLSTTPGENIMAEKDAVTYYALTDFFGTGDMPVSLSHNDDDTFTLGEFNIGTFSYADDFVPETLAMAFGGTAKKGNREELLAELQGLSNPTALTHVQYDASQTRQNQEFYDLQGHRLAAPQKGICIVKTTLMGGTTTTHKVVLAD